MFDAFSDPSWNIAKVCTLLLPDLFLICLISCAASLFTLLCWSGSTIFCSSLLLTSSTVYSCWSVSILICSSVSLSYTFFYCMSVLLLFHCPPSLFIYLLYWSATLLATCRVRSWRRWRTKLQTEIKMKLEQLGKSLMTMAKLHQNSSYHQHNQQGPT